MTMTRNVDVSFTKARSIFGSDAAPFNFKIAPSGNGLTWTTSELEGEKRKIVIAALGSGWVAKDISEALDVSTQFVYRVRKYGIEAGLLKMEGRRCQ